MGAPLEGYSQEEELAITASRAAAALCERVREHLVAASAATKVDRSPVTVADFGAQAIVSHLLEEALPADSLMGEEESALLRDAGRSELLERVVDEVRQNSPGASEADVLRWIDRARASGGRGRFWTLDPLDGTKGFLRGGQYAVALALLVEGRVEVGALACPRLELRAPSGSARGGVFVATRRSGAGWIASDGASRSTLRVSGSSDPSRSRLLESVEAAHGDHDAHAGIRRHLRITAEPVRMDSQAKYAALAHGDAEIYLRLPTSAEYRENVWDHAAGALLVEEAGGRVTDMHGKPLDFTAGRKLERNRGVVATNGRVHDAVLEAIRSLGGGAP